MKLNYYKKIEDRGDFARQLSFFLDHRGFNPYKPNINDDSFWTIDANNDWKVSFYNDTEFELSYRYETRYDISNQDEKPSHLLSKWIAWKWSLDCVTET